ncbi:Dynein, axonemal, light intermediate chain 1 [Perkinsus olseni]|uniref:Dynein, axonemal, light intermediate chain 1 n=1 Tax=Perkinsus olseni TaxID=32597 RepID=A0A7J6QBY0_PEROL|nr:Dynein, axonemal, light intermediate chain 1 [Perkinsus olseni]KAF4739927.1 Dynein, axonemal, light intermediate chain 1 [Perkinsus olseni]
MATAVLPQECPRESLVRYDPPQDVGEAPEPPVNPEEDELKFLGIEASDPDKAIADAIAAQLTESAELPPMDSKPTTEDVLHILLPPREWAENGRHILQHVNNQPSTRLDVIQLQEALDEKLMERQARETGICPVREELYGQCFDELIRQVTLDCPERGLLLLRIRNEIRMTIAAYQTLYHSSVVFGTRKQIQSEEGKDEAEHKLQELREKRRTLATKLAELERRCEAIERREAERNNIDERKRKEEIDFLKHQGQHLQTFLEGLEK